ncbi:hypothetical protein ABK040_000177 [Willaertia magna]
MKRLIIVFIILWLAVWIAKGNALECGEEKVMFYKDEDETRTPQCGECIPGSSGVDTKAFCNMDEYCSDNGTCIHVSKQPLYRTSCPYEIKAKKTKNGLCGPGLRCLQHVCKQCIDGMVDYADGKICINGLWTYNTFQLAIYHPTVIFFSCFILLVLVHNILDLCLDVVYVFRKKRKQQLEEKYKTFYNYLKSLHKEEVVNN